MICDSVLEAVGRTPLVRLRRVMSGAPPLVAAKLEFVNPGGSIKDRIALAMIEDAERRGLLRPGGTIIEGTSGNTGMGLAMVAAVKGYRAIFTMPDKMSQEKIDTLRALGAEVVVTPTAVPHEDPRSYHAVAARLNQEIPNSFFPNQYDNPNNPRAHFETTGPEIWEQTEGRVTHVVIGVGTGGTVTGVGRYLKGKRKDVKIIGVDPVGSIFHDLFKSGKQPPTNPYKVEGVGQDEMPKNVDFSLIDDMYAIGDKEAFQMTRALARQEGIFAGGSSGMAIAATVRLARTLKPTDLVVVLLPDSGSRYLSKIYNDNWMKEHQFLEPPMRMNVGQILAQKDAITATLIAVKSDATIGHAIEVMRSHAISQIPVLAADNPRQVLGSVDENRLLNVLLRNPNAWDHNVLEFMDAPFPRVPEDATTDQLANMLGNAPAVMVERRDGTRTLLTKSDLLFSLLNAEKQRSAG
jgi:cystathionine beta-synthase